jgi:hypothetical protein
LATSIIWEHAISKEENTMLDKLTTEVVADDFTAAELEIFSQARAAGDGLRRSFDAWITIGRATEIARKHADAAGGTQIIRGRKFRAILDQQGLGWFKRNDAAQILKLLAKLSEVVTWRAGLTDHQRLRWASPLSVINRAVESNGKPIFRPNGKVRGPASLRAKPMTVSELLKMPSDDIALLIYRRVPAKMFAVMRSMEALAASGSAVKPKSGYAIARERAAGASVAAAA